MTSDEKRDAMNDDERDILEVLHNFADAYPESVFPTPSDDRRAKDSAAADVVRVMALPWFAKAADEIERLRAELALANAALLVSRAVAQLAAPSRRNSGDPTSHSEADAMTPDEKRDAP